MEIYTKSVHCFAGHVVPGNGQVSGPKMGWAGLWFNCSCAKLWTMAQL